MTSRSRSEQPTNPPMVKTTCHLCRQVVHATRRSHMRTHSWFERLCYWFDHGWNVR